MFAMNDIAPKEGCSTVLVDSRRLMALDLVKALGIIMVILTHVADIPHAVKEYVLWPLTIVPAVPLFLLASIYAYSLSEEKKDWDILSWFENKRFYRRFSRLFGAWIITIGLQIILLVIVLDAKKNYTVINY